MSSVLLNYYFPLPNNWCICPEWVAKENYKPDYSIFQLLNNGNVVYFNIPYVILEVKQWGVISWENLISNQLYNQADALKDSNGRLWVIGQRGLEICFFFYLM